MIPEEQVVAFVQRHFNFLKSNRLSFFEMTVGMAFDYFRREKVDMAIIEVGMGGRLDSTNIIIPEVSVITNIGLDHTQFLGNTLTLVAREKAGIIKPSIPVVIGETGDETQAVFEEVAARKNASLIFAESVDAAQYASDLKGNYQKKNIKTVLATIEILRGQGWQISEEAVETGLLHTVKNTGLRGRWEVLQQRPKVICDTGHNKEGLKLVMEQLQLENFARLHIVLGVVADKDLASILPLFPADATYYFCKPNIPRGMDAALLAEKAREESLAGEEYFSVEEAFGAALRNASEEDLIFVGGSTFVVAEVL